MISSRVLMLAALTLSATTMTTTRAVAQDARAAPNPAAVARVRAQYLKREVVIPMRDGTLLYADIFRLGNFCGR